jgi:hypothetical protein
LSKSREHTGVFLRKFWLLDESQCSLGGDAGSRAVWSLSIEQEEKWLRSLGVGAIILLGHKAHKGFTKITKAFGSAR